MERTKVKAQAEEDQERLWKKRRRVKARQRHLRNRLLLIICFVGMIMALRSALPQLGIQSDADIPESLIEFGQKYPEAKGYVNNFPRYKDKDFDMDVSSELTAGEIPLFLQWDKRWGYKSYGSNYIGVAGCGPTCMAMVACGLTGNSKYNPYYVVKLSEEQGYYIAGQGTSWNLMTEGAEKLGLWSGHGKISEEYIREKLAPDSPMICSMAPGDFTYTGHFIVLTGFDADGRLIVNDPNSPKNSKKHWSMEELLPQIKGIWRYQYGWRDSNSPPFFA